jgi:hypothetical protein
MFQLMVHYIQEQKNQPDIIRLFQNWMLQNSELLLVQGEIVIFKAQNQLNETLLTNYIANHCQDFEFIWSTNHEVKVNFAH